MKPPIHWSGPGSGVTSANSECPRASEGSGPLCGQGSLLVVATFELRPEGPGALGLAERRRGAVLTRRASSTVAEVPGITKREKQKEVYSVSAMSGEAHLAASFLARSSALRLTPRSPRPCSSRPARPIHLATLVLALLIKLFTTCRPVS